MKAHRLACASCALFLAACGLIKKEDKSDAGAAPTVAAAPPPPVSVTPVMTPDHSGGMRGLPTGGSIPPECEKYLTEYACYLKKQKSERADEIIANLRMGYSMGAGFAGDAIAESCRSAHKGLAAEIKKAGCAQ